MSDSAYRTMLARRSIRKYTDQPLTPEEIHRLLEAAMAAPSANNSLPWHFVVITERGVLDRLAQVHPYAKMLSQAPACIAVCGDPEDVYWAQACSAATQNILLEAVELGLGTVWVGVHPRSDRERQLRDILGMPPRITPLCMIAIGHPAEEKEPRTQYDEARVHREHW